MASYAVIGSTGTVGGSVIDVLLQSPERNVHAYARSTKKLFTLHPEWEKSPNVRAFQGNLDDTEVLADCISDTRSVFMCAGATSNDPKCDVARQQAKSVVKAIDELRKRDSQARLAQLIILSSAATEAYLMSDLPAVFYWLLDTAGSYIYSDLKLAEQFLRKRDDIKQVYIKPGGLVQDVAHGHELNTERQETFLSFIDLAGGMVDVAEADDDRWDLKNVSVVPTSKGTKVEWGVPYYMLKGLLCHACPWLYPTIATWLP
ncbi:hypothetical protein LTR09_000851 [Extremus antarcticus]|uniref:NAD(P)-binding domain-containing protein n=1 Tax=Extremus antarcticus TaxID=702011 RepID=A0AAJ0GHN8_9PEZI|nr:hypothetical protein LTR09_000851 [Extremus antarcticus]